MGNSLVSPDFRVSWGLVAMIHFGRAWSGRREGFVGCVERWKRDKVMLLPRNTFIFSARIWGASVGSPKVGWSAGNSIGAKSFNSHLSLQGPGESRWDHRKEHSSKRETWRREGEQSGEQGQGEVQEGHHQR